MHCSTIGVDIGGTLTKVTLIENESGGHISPKNRGPSALYSFVLSRTTYGKTGHRLLDLTIRDIELPSRVGRQTLHFISFETARISQALDLITDALQLSEDPSADPPSDGGHHNIVLTGGGAFKYKQLIEGHSALKDWTVTVVDEMRALIRGIDFVLTRLAPAAWPGSDSSSDYNRHRSEKEKEGPGQQRVLENPGSGDDDSTAPDHYYYYTYDPDKIAVALEEGVAMGVGKLLEVPIRPLESSAGPDGKAIYPYLVCNVGTGVSILKVTGSGSFCRVSGSGIGGGTFWGLCRMLTKYRDFTEALEDAAAKDGGGRTENCDLLVKDIYGDSYEELGLPGNLVAGFFAASRPSSDKDRALALLMMVTNNLGQIATQIAKEHGMDRVLFTGGFMQQLESNSGGGGGGGGDNGPRDIVKRAVAQAVWFWSGGQIQACFVGHDMFLGSCGASLMAQPPQAG